MNATRFLGRLAIAAVQLYVVALLIWQVLRFYPGDRWLPVRLGSYFAPWLFMALFPTLIVALLGQRRWLVGLVTLLILIHGTHYWPTLIPRLSQARADEHAGNFRVMTFNVHYANRNAPEIAKLIAGEAPDLVALQELTPGLAALLLPELEFTYPYHLTGEGSGFEKALLSRYPLTALPSRPETGGGLPALVETPDGPVLVWNVHPRPAVKQTGWRVQKQTLSALAQEIEQETRPLIVLGDLNTTDTADNYDLIAQHLTDVHRAVGWGFGFTFPEPDVVARMQWSVQPLSLVSPVVRIDYVFASQHFTPQEVHVIPNGFGSDHRPVVATLRFAK